MTRFVTICLALMGCAPDDITIVVDPEIQDSYLEAVDTCVELWTPLTPLTIGWQFGRDHIPIGSMPLRVVSADDLDGLLGHHCGDGCGGTRQIRIIDEFAKRYGRPDSWWQQRVICHEIGHAIGFGPEHNCPQGSLMGILDRSTEELRSKWVNVPGKCEAQRLGVEL